MAKEGLAAEYQAFWEWFRGQADAFYGVLKNHGDVETDFFDLLMAQLGKIRDGYYFLAGIKDDGTADLVFTADGDIRNIVFVEELVAHAPSIPGWTFGALKPSLPIEDVGLEMAGFKFNRNNISFYPNENPAYPDKVDITVVHHDFIQLHKATIERGVCIFLDNYLGELNFINNIDELSVRGPEPDSPTLVPIDKLKDYLVWRQTEFVEKYQGAHFQTDDEQFLMFEAQLTSGNPLLAIVNTEILHWESKVSHPWVAVLTMRYEANKENGMPTKVDYERMTVIEDAIVQRLESIPGNIFISHQTAEGQRIAYFVCQDFRVPSKIIQEAITEYSGQFPMTFDIFKDKYWQTFEQFADI